MNATVNGHPPPNDTAVMESNEAVLPTMIPHSEEEILLEKIHYENDEDNSPDKLSPLDQSILLSLCLNVKNNNPLDGLTAEEMGAYLERVLVQHDDWMIFSTALLERVSWHLICPMLFFHLLKICFYRTLFCSSSQNTHARTRCLRLGLNVKKFMDGKELSYRSKH
jgi:hypothetical protein